MFRKVPAWSRPWPRLSPKAAEFGVPDYAPKESPALTGAAGKAKNGSGPSKNEPAAPAQSFSVVSDETSGEHHIVNSKGEVVETYPTAAAAHADAGKLNDFVSQSPESEVAKPEPFLDPEDQKHFDAELGNLKATGIPVELTDDAGTTHPFAQDAMAWIDRKAGKIIVNKDSLKHFVNQLPKNRRASAIRSVLAEEQIHLHTDDAAALTYWKNLSPWEQAILKRRYTKGFDLKMHDVNWGHEALRYRIQQLARMKPTEVALAVGKEKWTLKALTVAEHAIRGARSVINFKSSRESNAILKRIQQNIDTAKLAIRGVSPAALGRGRPPKRQESKEQEQFILPGAESTRLAGSTIAASNKPGQEGAELPKVSDEVKASGDATVAARVPQRPTAAQLGEIGAKTLSDDVAARLEDAKAGKNTRLPNLKDFTADLKKKWSGLKPGEISDLWSGSVGKMIDQMPGEDLRLLGKSAFGGNVREILSDKDLNEKFPGNPKAAVEYARRQERALSREGKKSGSIWNGPVPDAPKPGEGPIGDFQKAEIKQHELEQNLRNAIDGGDSESAARIRSGIADVKYHILHKLKEPYKAAVQAQKRRGWIASALFRKMVKPEVPDSEGILNRKSVTPDDVRTSNDGKHSSYTNLSGMPESKIAEALADKARRSSSDSATITRRLAVLENKRTGEVSMVSAYDHPHGPELEHDVRVLDPLSATRTHVPLTELLKRYKALRSVFLDQPVRKFRQDFTDIDEFNDKFGNQVEEDVRNASRYSPDEISTSEFAQEAGGRISGGSGGSFQGPHRDLVSDPEHGAAEKAETTPLTGAEGRAVNDLLEAGGSPRNAADVKRVLQEMTERKPSALVISALRKMAADIQKSHPDYDEDGMLNALAHKIYENKTRAALPEGVKAKAANPGQDAGAGQQSKQPPAQNQPDTTQRGAAGTQDVSPAAFSRRKYEDRDWEFPVRQGSVSGHRDFPDLPYYIRKKDWQSVSKAIRDWQGKIHGNPVDDSSVAIHLMGMATNDEKHWGEGDFHMEGGHLVGSDFPLDKEAVTRYFDKMEGSPYGRKALLDQEIKDNANDPDRAKLFEDLRRELYPEESTVVPDYRQPGLDFGSPAAFNRRRLEDAREETALKLGVTKQRVANAFKARDTRAHMAATIDGMDTIGNNMGQNAEWSVRMESADAAKNRIGYAKDFRGKKDILESAPALLSAGGIKTIYKYDAKALAEKARLLREDEYFVKRAHDMKSMLERSPKGDVSAAQREIGTQIQNRLIETGFLNHRDSSYVYDNGARGKLDMFMFQLRQGTEQAETMIKRGNIWDKYRKGLEEIEREADADAGIRKGTVGKPGAT